MPTSMTMATSSTMSSNCNTVNNTANSSITNHHHYQYHTSENNFVYEVCKNLVNRASSATVLKFQLNVEQWKKEGVHIHNDDSIASISCSNNSGGVVRGTSTSYNNKNPNSILTFNQTHKPTKSSLSMFHNQKQQQTLTQNNQTQPQKFFNNNRHSIAKKQPQVLNSSHLQPQFPSSNPNNEINSQIETQNIYQSQQIIIENLNQFVDLMFNHRDERGNQNNSSSLSTQGGNNGEQQKQTPISNLNGHQPQALTSSMTIPKINQQILLQSQQNQSNPTIINYKFLQNDIQICISVLGSINSTINNSTNSPQNNSQEKISYKKLLEDLISKNKNEHFNKQYEMLQTKKHILYHHQHSQPEQQPQSTVHHNTSSKCQKNNSRNSVNSPLLQSSRKNSTTNIPTSQPQKSPTATAAVTATVTATGNLSSVPKQTYHKILLFLFTNANTRTTIHSNQTINKSHKTFTNIPYPPPNQQKQFQSKGQPSKIHLQTQQFTEQSSYNYQYQNEHNNNVKSSSINPIHQNRNTNNNNNKEMMNSNNNLRQKTQYPHVDPSHNSTIDALKDWKIKDQDINITEKLSKEYVLIKQQIENQKINFKNKLKIFEAIIGQNVNVEKLLNEEKQLLTVGNGASGGATNNLLTINSHKMGTTAGNQSIPPNSGNNSIGAINEYQQQQLQAPNNQQQQLQLQQTQHDTNNLLSAVSTTTEHKFLQSQSPPSLPLPSSNSSTILSQSTPNNNPNPNNIIPQTPTTSSSSSSISEFKRLKESFQIIRNIDHQITQQNKKIQLSKKCLKDMKKQKNQQLYQHTKILNGIRKDILGVKEDIKEQTVQMEIKNKMLSSLNQKKERVNEEVFVGGDEQNQCRDAHYDNLTGKQKVVKAGGGVKGGYNNQGKNNYFNKGSNMLYRGTQNLKMKSSCQGGNSPFSSNHNDDCSFNKNFIPTLEGQQILNGNIQLLQKIIKNQHPSQDKTIIINRPSSTFSSSFYQPQSQQSKISDHNNKNFAIRKQHKSFYNHNNNYQQKLNNNSNISTNGHMNDAIKYTVGAEQRLSSVKTKTHTHTRKTYHLNQTKKNLQLLQKRKQQVENNFLEVSMMGEKTIINRNHMLNHSQKQNQNQNQKDFSTIYNNKGKQNQNKTTINQTKDISTVKTKFPLKLPFQQILQHRHYNQEEQCLINLYRHYEQNQSVLNQCQQYLQIANNSNKGAVKCSNNKKNEQNVNPMKRVNHQNSQTNKIEFPYLLQKILFPAIISTTTTNNTTVLAKTKTNHSKRNQQKYQQLTEFLQNSALFHEDRHSKAPFSILSNNGKPTNSPFHPLLNESILALSQTSSSQSSISDDSDNSDCKSINEQQITTADPMQQEKGNKRLTIDNLFQQKPQSLLMQQ